jgi:hypothetical protein
MINIIHFIKHVGDTKNTSSFKGTGLKTYTLIMFTIMMIKHVQTTYLKNKKLLKWHVLLIYISIHGRLDLICFCSNVDYIKHITLQKCTALTVSQIQVTIIVPTCV